MATAGTVSVITPSASSKPWEGAGVAVGAMICPERRSMPERST